MNTDNVYTVYNTVAQSTMTFEDICRKIYILINIMRSSQEFNLTTTYNVARELYNDYMQVLVMLA